MSSYNHEVHVQILTLYKHRHSDLNDFWHTRYPPYKNYWRFLTQCRTDDVLGNHLDIWFLAIVSNSL